MRTGLELSSIVPIAMPHSISSINGSAPLREHKEVLPVSKEVLPVRKDVLPLRKEVLGLGLGLGKRELRMAPCHETPHSTLGVAQSKVGPGRSETSQPPGAMERATFRPRGYQ